MTKCFGCDVEPVAEHHPFIGVVYVTAVKLVDWCSEVADRTNGSGFVDVPICALCHTDSGHRVRTVKVAFFTYEERRTAVINANREA